MKKKKSFYSVLFKITSRCNDSCDFCIERKFIRAKRRDLTLAEIKTNLQYLKKKYPLDYVLITGGEPTLHPDFLAIADYFSKQEMEHRIITNLIKFGNSNFFKKTLPFLKNAKIIGSINDLPTDVCTAARIKGLKNILKNGLSLMLVTVIYKDNLDSLDKLVKYLASLFKKYKKPINLELRMIYIEGTMDSLLKKSLPVDFEKLKLSVQKAVDDANKAGVTLTIWNFPLCYLDRIPADINKGVKKRCQRKLLKISKDFQEKNVQIRDFEEYFEKGKKCLKCSYNNRCSGIDKLYLKRYHFPLRFL